MQSHTILGVGCMAIVERDGVAGFTAGTFLRTDHPSDTAHRTPWC